MSSYKEYLQREPKLALSKSLKITAWVLTAVVLGLVGLMRRPELKITLPDGFSFSFLPPVHATLNSIVAIALVVAVLEVSVGGRVGVGGAMLGCRWVLWEPRDLVEHAQGLLLLPRQRRRLVQKPFP